MEDNTKLAGLGRNLNYDIGKLFKLIDFISMIMLLSEYLKKLDADFFNRL